MEKELQAQPAAANARGQGEAPELSKFATVASLPLLPRRHSVCKPTTRVEAGGYLVDPVRAVGVPGPDVGLVETAQPPACPSQHKLRASGLARAG